MHDDPIDPLPDLLASIDQAIETVPQIARYAWALYEGFTAEGFTESQALRLTMSQLNASTE